MLPQHLGEGLGCHQPPRRGCGHLSVPRPLTGSAQNAAGMGQFSCVHRLRDLHASRGYPWAGERAWEMMLGTVHREHRHGPYVVLRFESVRVDEFASDYLVNDRFGPYREFRWRTEIEIIFNSLRPLLFDFERWILISDRRNLSPLHKRLCFEADL